MQRSQVPHDISREAVERILPKLLGGYVGFNYFKDGQYAEAPSKLAAFYLQKMQYFHVCERRARDCLIFGRGVTKWLYRYDERQRRRTLTTPEIMAFQRAGFTKFPRKVTETIVAYDGPMAYNVDPFTMTYDTSVDDPTKCYFTFEEFRMTVQQMQGEVTAGRYDADAVAQYETETPPTQPGFVDRWRNEAIARIGIDYGTAYSLSEPTAFALEEGYFPFDIDGDGKDESILIVCDPGFKVCFRLQENPFDHGQAPYTYHDWLRITGEFWPIGVIEILEPTQTMLNVWSNLGVDNIVLSIFNLWLKHRDAHIPGNSLMLLPNRIIPTNMMDGLQPLRPNDHTSNVMTYQQFYLKRAQEQSGVTQFNALGSPEMGQTRTALGIQTLKQAAEEFLGFAKKRMVEITMHSDAEFLLELLRQFMDEAKQVVLLGDDNQADTGWVQPDDLFGNFDWQAVVESQSPLSRELDSSNFENWVATTTKIGVPLNMPLVAQELGRRKGITRPERWFAPQAPTGSAATPGLNIQNMQARQAIAAGGGGQQESLAGGPQPAGGATQLGGGMGGPP